MKKSILLLLLVSLLAACSNSNWRTASRESAGIAIDPDKGQKILPNCSCLFNVVFTTRKTAKFGKQKYVVPIDVKGGPSYIIEFITNLTIPELHMSNDNVDFNKVCV